MIPESTFNRYYVEPTVLIFPWKGHKLSTQVKQSKVTINHYLKVRLEAGNILSFSFNESQGAMAGLNGRRMSNQYNSGPFMDLLSFSFKPASNNCDLESHSVSPTQIEENTFTYQKTRGMSCEVSAQLSRGKSVGEKITKTSGGNIGPRVNFNQSQTSITSCRRLEFIEVRNQEGRKEIISLVMNACYQDNQAIKYNNPLSLRCSNVDKRVAVGTMVPLIGWFGLFLLFPDTVYSPPECAISTLGRGCTLKYKFSEGPLCFKYSTLVRTVFASNDSKVPKGTGMRDHLNWVITIHKVKRKIEVQINDNGLNVREISSKKQKYCFMGYEKTLTKINFQKQIGDGKFREINNKERKQEIYDKFAPSHIEKIRL